MPVRAPRKPRALAIAIPAPAPPMTGLVTGIAAALLALLGALALR
jgi:hypothetical protein